MSAHRPVLAIVGATATQQIYDATGSDSVEIASFGQVGFPSTIPAGGTVTESFSYTVTIHNDGLAYQGFLPPICTPVLPAGKAKTPESRAQLESGHCLPMALATQFVFRSLRTASMKSRSRKHWSQRLRQRPTRNSQLSTLNFLSIPFHISDDQPRRFL